MSTIIRLLPFAARSLLWMQRGRPIVQEIDRLLDRHQELMLESDQILGKCSDLQARLGALDHHFGIGEDGSDAWAKS